MKEHAGFKITTTENFSGRFFYIEEFLDIFVREKLRKPFFEFI